MSFPGQSLQRAWHLVDAKNQTVGRLANQISSILKGKHKPTYRPNGDMGDYVVVINAEQVHFSGTKWKNKLYRHHTGYPGGLKEKPASRMLLTHPTEVLRKAILGQLKRNNLRHQSIEPRLKLYAGPEHPHTAQLGENAVPVPSPPRSRTGKFGFGLHTYDSSTSTSTRKA
mmetsp:Transcript_10899/g.26011  ORF Transcript_10899/g.26011 Transcript_10899/m.26011 type:complete len:171 (+) Transcript_10899:73-585(+)